MMLDEQKSVSGSSGRAGASHVSFGHGMSVELLMDLDRIKRQFEESPEDNKFNFSPKGYSLPHASCLQDDPSILNFYLEKGLDPNTVTRNQQAQSLLQTACFGQKIEIIKRLFQETSLDIHYVDSDNNPAIKMAMRFHNVGILRLFHARWPLSKGPIVKGVQMPSHYYLDMAIALGSVASVVYLIDECGVSFPEGEYASNALMVAVERGYSELVELLFIIPGLNLNAMLKNISTPLMIACERGNLALAKRLVAHGVDPKQDWRGKDRANSPLQSAVVTGQVEVLKWLVEVCGVDVNHEIASFESRGHLSSSSVWRMASTGEAPVVGGEQRKLSVTPLFQAVGNHQLGVIQYLLKREEIQCTHEFIFACIAGYAEAVKLMVKRFPDFLKAKNQLGLTVPEMISVQTNPQHQVFGISVDEAGRREIGAYLVKNHLKTLIEIWSKDPKRPLLALLKHWEPNDKCRALNYACELGKQPLIAALNEGPHSFQDAVQHLHVHTVRYMLSRRQPSDAWLSSLFSGYCVDNASEQIQFCLEHLPIKFPLFLACRVHSVSAVQAILKKDPELLTITEKGRTVFETLGPEDEAIRLYLLDHHLDRLISDGNLHASREYVQALISPVTDLPMVLDRALQLGADQVVEHVLAMADLSECLSWMMTRQKYDGYEHVLRSTRIQSGHIHETLEHILTLRQPKWLNAFIASGRLSLEELLRISLEKDHGWMCKIVCDHPSSEGLMTKDAILQAACQHGASQVVETLLIEYRLNLANPYAGKTPLMVAIEAGHVNVVKCLKAHGADLKNPLSPGGFVSVVQSGRVDLCDYFYRQLLPETQKSVLSTPSDLDKVTPLEMACRSGRMDLFDWVFKRLQDFRLEGWMHSNLSKVFDAAAMGGSWEIMTKLLVGLELIPPSKVSLLVQAARSGQVLMLKNLLHRFHRESADRDTQNQILGAAFDGVESKKSIRIACEGFD
jgi:ankyrin repeat protein